MIFTQFLAYDTVGISGIKSAKVKGVLLDARHTYNSNPLSVIALNNRRKVFLTSNNMRTSTVNGILEEIQDWADSPFGKPILRLGLGTNALIRTIKHFLGC